MSVLCRLGASATSDVDQSGRAEQRDGRSVWHRDHPARLLAIPPYHACARLSRWFRTLYSSILFTYLPLLTYHIPLFLTSLFGSPHFHSFIPSYSLTIYLTI